jgi:hypothetical protein
MYDFTHYSPLLFHVITSSNSKNFQQDLQNGLIDSCRRPSDHPGESESLPD